MIRLKKASAKYMADAIYSAKAFIFYTLCTSPHLPVYFLSHKVEAAYLHQYGKDPGYGVGNKQHGQRSVGWKDSKDPYDSGSHSTDDGQDHRNSGMPNSTKRPRKQIHQSAEKIGNCGKGHDLHSCMDHIRLSGIDLQDLRPKKVSAAAQSQRTCHRQNNTVHKNPVHALPFPDTVILTGKAHTCLGNGIYRDIQKSKYIIGSCISCHSHRAKGVDRGLKERVGKIDDRTLNSRRNPYLENLFQVFFFYGKPGKAQLIASL